MFRQSHSDKSVHVAADRDGDGTGDRSNTAGTFACDNSPRREAEPTLDRTRHVHLLREISRLTESYSALQLTLTKDEILIPSSGHVGFPMSVRVDRDRYVVRLGDWQDETALASEAVELLEASLGGEIRLRIDADAVGEHVSAERRLASGEWAGLPQQHVANAHAPTPGAFRSLYLRNTRRSNSD